MFWPASSFKIDYTQLRKKATAAQWSHILHSPLRIQRLIKEKDRFNFFNFLFLGYLSNTCLRLFGISKLSCLNLLQWIHYFSYCAFVWTSLLHFFLVLCVWDNSNNSWHFLVLLRGPVEWIGKKVSLKPNSTLSKTTFCCLQELKAS
jgi:hypothetical protein